MSVCSLYQYVGWIEYTWQGGERYRAGRLVNSQLESCVFFSPEFVLPPRDWLASLFDNELLNYDERASLLTARPPDG